MKIWAAVQLLGHEKLGFYPSNIQEAQWGCSSRERLYKQ